MRVDGQHYRTVWLDGTDVHLIDQNRLPFAFAIVTCRRHEETAAAIKDMTVRGAPAIGAAAGFALAQAFHEALAAADLWSYAATARRRIEATRPTARDLFTHTGAVWAAAERAENPTTAARAASETATALADASAAACRRIGEVGEGLIRPGARVLTHCNAGWVACVDYGTATAPIYRAVAMGRPVHVWVDETRPRGQGARLTAWELHNEGVSHRIIADNAAAFLMSRGDVDLVIVGADRVAGNGDVANKIGTLEKAICAREFGVPFYVAAPPATFDLSLPTGADIPIEERAPDELLYQTGPDEAGVVRRIRVASPGSGAFNPAFDVTPARLITGIITENGVLTPGAWPAAMTRSGGSVQLTPRPGRPHVQRGSSLLL